MQRYNRILLLITIVCVILKFMYMCTYIGTHMCVREKERERAREIERINHFSTHVQHRGVTFLSYHYQIYEYIIYVYIYD